ncbi:MAG: aminoacyl-histidine dipeptidase [Clostridia bacterium]|nr:aminoacyl-histidine dipeptidase [Clostridia bacterium]
MLNVSDYPSAERVFHFFEEISKIPHGSGNTDKIADYLVGFANEHALYVRRDEANNVIIRKNATRGYTDRPTVILQGHTDMVAEKTHDCTKNMLTDGLDIYRDGDLIRARGTTLGGDDGVAVAMALAILDSNDIPHPELEAIFTSDEEIGLLGAVALNTGDVRGRLLINIDSDVEGIFTVGCAGGMRIDLHVPMRVTNSAKKCFEISVTGLKGGHSGIEIDKGRENAVKILAMMLSMLSARLADVRGGNADNAIPRAASAVIECGERSAEDVLSLCELIAGEYREIEPEISVTVKEYGDAVICDAESSENLVSLLMEEPSGVIAMSSDIEGLVETSLNLGILKCEGGEAVISFSVRSAKGSEKAKLATRVTKTAENHGATYAIHGEYPAWEYRKDSHLRDVMCEVYRRMYQKEAQVVTIHAGLECGIFCDKIEGLDCVSIGPDNYDIHTTEERLSVSSTARVWEFLKEVLKNI